ncbi:hypothetical protein WDU94_009659 [Cyamophila willieti]
MVTGREIQPNPVGEEAGTVVFQYYPMSAVNYFSRSCVGGNRFFVSNFASEKTTDLKFESRFESGNLAKAVKISDNYYELYLRTDLYTNRHMQWFYFRITNTRSNVYYRFSIVNLSKSESLYSVGMKPLLYSTRDAEINKIGWRRCGENITYFRNDLRKKAIVITSRVHPGETPSSWMMKGFLDFLTGDSTKPKNFGKSSSSNSFQC